MKIIIVGTENEFDSTAAQAVADQVAINDHSVFTLATGKTALGYFARLADPKYKADYSNVKFLSLDEYYGVELNSEGTTSTYLEKNLFSQINVKRQNIFKLNSNPLNGDSETESYDKLIKSLGGIDLMMLGIGLNGHIGFNEPGCDWNSGTNIRELTVLTRESSNRFTGEIKQPDRGITMGIKTIMNSRKIILLAKGAGKAEIISKTIKGRITPDVPASILQLHPDCTCLLDREAARLL